MTISLTDPPCKSASMAAPLKRCGLQDLTLRREAERSRAAWTYYPMPSTFLLLPALTALPPAAAVVWFPGMLGGVTAVTVVLFGIALYLTRRVFALQGHEWPSTNWWDAAGWRLPVTADLVAVTAAMMVLLAALSAGFLFSVATFTVATWAWLVGRGACAARRQGISGWPLVKAVHAQWKKRRAEYNKPR